MTDPGILLRDRCHLIRMRDSAVAAVRAAVHFLHSLHTRPQCSPSGIAVVVLHALASAAGGSAGGTLNAHSSGSAADTRAVRSPLQSLLLRARRGLPNPRPIAEPRAVVTPTEKSQTSGRSYHQASAGRLPKVGQSTRVTSGDSRRADNCRRPGECSRFPPGIAEPDHRTRPQLLDSPCERSRVGRSVPGSFGSGFRHEPLRSPEPTGWLQPFRFDRWQSGYQMPEAGCLRRSRQQHPVWQPLPIFFPAETECPHTQWRWLHRDCLHHATAEIVG